MWWDWLRGKVSQRYRIGYVSRTGVYLWSIRDAMKDGGLQFMAQVALLRANMALGKGGE